MDNAQRIIMIIIINHPWLQVVDKLCVLQSVLNFSVLYYYFMLATEMWMLCNPLGKYKVFKLRSRERVIEASD
jgi:hypothetical protein